MEPGLILTIREFLDALFPSASGEADNMNRLFLQYLVFAGFILALVALLVILGALLYRSSKRPGEPEQKEGNKVLEITWTVLPLIAVTIFFFLTLKSMKEINRPLAEGQKPDIDIIAHQWWWEMRYPEQGVVTANELHIPVGEHLLMRLQSADVIHSWWVQDLGRKTDAVPGQTNYAWLQSDSIGVYEGACSEYCGMQHAWMRIKVVVESKDDFEKWIMHQKQTAENPNDSLSQAGYELFQTMTCASCHSIKGTAADSRIGPDLTHFASRKTMLSGMMEQDSVNLRKWLENPQKVKEGAHMPDFILKPRELDALVKYLEDLK